VAAVTAAGPRSLFGKAYTAARSACGRSKPGHVAAAVAVAVAREYVLTVAALASADLGAFHWGRGVGFLAAGVSLLALDFAVRG
jgi:hypothetical protein